MCQKMADIGVVSSGIKFGYDWQRTSFTNNDSESDRQTQNVTGRPHVLD
jgi:hypothetical protein